MFRRCILLFVVASLAVSAGPAWATSIFVNVSSFNPSGTTDLQAFPTGVSPLSAGGGVSVEASTAANANYYDVCYYSGGTAGTFTRMASALSYSGATYSHAVGSNMNDQGDFTSTVFQATPQVQWLTTNQGATTTYFNTSPTGNQIRGIGIDENDDICGVYLGRPTTYGAYPYIGMNNGGGSFTIYTPTSNYDSWVTGMTTPTTAAGVTSGMAAGFALAGSPFRAHPEVWTYSITGGVMTSSVTDLMGGTGYAPLSGVYPSVTGASAMAINSSGLAVIAATNTGTITSPIENCTEGLLYNINTQTFTPLTQGSTTLKFTDSIGPTLTEGSGHDQAIDNNGDVVGYIGTSGSTWHAAEYTPNGNITDLNTLYASVLPTGVVLNNATAIDNNGDIAGVCTVNGNVMQAFVIYNAAATPEPGTLALLAAGLVGLLACAWRKRK